MENSLVYPIIPFIPIYRLFSPLKSPFMVSVRTRCSPTPERKKRYSLDQALVADRRSKELEAKAIVRNRGFWLIIIILVIYFVFQVYFQLRGIVSADHARVPS